MIITFCGNKDILGKEAVLNKLIESLTLYFTEKHDSGLTFYCGAKGDFDRLASEAIDLLRKKFPDKKAEKIFVTPYITPAYQETINLIKKYYDDVIYPPIEDAPPKFAISRRNEWMVDSSQIVIAYVAYHWGGSAKTLQYAKRKNKEIIDLTD